MQHNEVEALARELKSAQETAMDRRRSITAACGWLTRRAPAHTRPIRKPPDSAADGMIACQRSLASGSASRYGTRQGIVSSVVPNARRSEEHTSELQSPRHL